MAYAERLKPMLFDDDDATAAAASAPRSSPPPALTGRPGKRASKLAVNGLPVHSFQSLLRDLATCTLNEVDAGIALWR
jgi:hypothetical protein